MEALLLASQEFNIAEMAESAAGWPLQAEASAVMAVRLIAWI